jgi:hypothetical protein
VLFCGRRYRAYGLSSGKFHVDISETKASRI